MKVSVEQSRFQLAAPFRISREIQTEVDVMTVTLSEGGFAGRGETVGVSYRGETPDRLREQITEAAVHLSHGIDRNKLLEIMTPGGARNAVDCALWDLEAKRSGVPAWRSAGVSGPTPVSMTVTLGLDTPARMAEAACRAGPFSALKLKLGEGDGDIERVAAVRSAAPDAVLLCDVNEAWSFDQLRRYTPELQALGMQMIEQPLRARDDEVLADYTSPVTLCADESCFDRSDLESVRHRYGAINIKLEKTGGLTEALHLARAAAAMRLQVMVGCMVSTSLSIAPALLLRSGGLWFDLDGPTYLVADRSHGIQFEAGMALPPSPQLWG